MMCTKRSYFCFTSDGLASIGKAISWTADRCYCSSFFSVHDSLAPISFFLLPFLSSQLMLRDGFVPSRKLLVHRPERVSQSIKKKQTILPKLFFFSLPFVNATLKAFPLL